MSGTQEWGAEAVAASKTAQWAAKLEQERKLIQQATAEKEATDMVNHPPHYKRGPKCDHCGQQIECINIVRNLNFNIGNAIKYLWRVGFGGKDNDAQDLRKAGWYAEDEAKLREKE